MLNIYHQAQLEVLIEQHIENCKDMAQYYLKDSNYSMAEIFIDEVIDYSIILEEIKR